jgi:hypothetical protein
MYNPSHSLQCVVRPYVAFRKAWGPTHSCLMVLGPLSLGTKRLQHTTDHVFQEYTEFSQMLEPPENSMRQKGDTEKVFNWGPTNIRQHGTKFGRPGDRDSCTRHIHIAKNLEYVEEPPGPLYFHCVVCRHKDNFIHTHSTSRYRM